jgi:probable HAF family extracellular repeat protein
MRKSFVVIAGLLLTLVSGWAQAQQTYRLTELGHLGGGFTRGTAVNDAGQVTGYSDSGSEIHAFFWDDTDTPKMTDLGTLGGTDSRGNALSNAGHVTGKYTDIFDHAFLWDGSTMDDFAPLEVDTYSVGKAVNDTGLVTGDFGAPSLSHAFLSDGIALVDLGTLEGTGRSSGASINASGQVTGFSSAGSSFHAFLAADGAPPTMTDLGTLGGAFSEGIAINDAGQVTGDSYPTGSGNLHAFLWDDSDIPKMTDLGTLGGLWSNSMAINASGQVAGCSDTGAGFHAFLAVGGTPPTMTDLGTLGGNNSQGNGINDAGQVTGYSDTGTDSHAFLWDGGPTGGPMEDLNDLIDLSDPLQPHVTLVEGFDINSPGQILALGHNSLTDQFLTYLVSPSPLSDLIATADAIGRGRTKEVFVTLEWTDTFGDETGFEIERAPNTGKGKRIQCGTFEYVGTAGAGSEVFEDDTTDRRTKYCYQIKVISPTVLPTPSNVTHVKTS